MRRFPPQRLICLTEETVETLYLLGEQDRIVGVSGYAVRPPEVRTKPRVSAFTSARLDKILALEPDLVLAFSDLQADIVRGVDQQGRPLGLGRGGDARHVERAAVRPMDRGDRDQGERRGAGALDRGHHR